MKNSILLFLVLLLALPVLGQSDAKALEVIQTSIAKSGGKEKLAAIKSMTRKMEINMPFGISESEAWYKDGKFYMKSTMQGNVMFEQKYDGTRAFIGGMQGNQTIDDEKMIKQIANQGKIFPQLSIINGEVTLKHDGMEKIEGEDCHRILAVDADGTTSKMYFNASTGLLSRMATTGEFQGTKVETVIDMKDYKPVEGILFAHKMQLNNGQFQMEMTVTELKFNVDIPDSMFFIN
jgi:outer membrane lipoprotein-sorting protein